MGTRTLTLTEFMLARIAEDEAATTALRDCDGVLDIITAAPCEEGRDYILRFQPGRMLDEIRAKRRIVEAHRDGDTDPFVTGWVLACLAQAHADHPEFREEWRP